MYAIETGQMHLKNILAIMVLLSWPAVTPTLGQQPVANVFTEGKHQDGKTVLGSAEGLKEGEYYWDRISSVGENGIRVAVLVRMGGKMQIVIDGNLSPEYDEIAWRPGKDPKKTNVFSPGGLHSNYRARTGDKWQLVADGVPGPKYDFIAEPVYSPDGRHIAYTAWNGTEQFMVVDGESGPAFDEILSAFLRDNPYAESDIKFTTDSRHYVYKARKGGKWRVMADGRPGPEFDELLMLNDFADTIEFIAYKARAGDRWELIIDGKSMPYGPDMAKADHFEISPDGRHLAYVTARGKNSIVVVDGSVGPSFDEIVSPFAWRSDGRLEYLAVETAGERQNLVRMVVPVPTVPVHSTR